MSVRRTPSAPCRGSRTDQSLRKRTPASLSLPTHPDSSSVMLLLAQEAVLVDVRGPLILRYGISGGEFVEARKHSPKWSPWAGKNFDFKHNPESSFSSVFPFVWASNDGFSLPRSNDGGTASISFVSERMKGKARRKDLGRIGSAKDRARMVCR